MTHLLVVILYKTSQLPDLLEAWHTVNVPGITVLNSAGGYRTRNWLHQAGFGAIGELFSSEDVRSKTLLSVIEDDDLLEQAIIEAERVIGDFYRPGSGLLFVLPVTRAVGIFRPEPEDNAVPVPPKTPHQEAMTEAERVTRDTLISAVTRISHSEPVIVKTHQTLMEVVGAMVEHPGVNVVCVVNEQERLVGLIPLKSLADDLFMIVVPEEFISETHDLEDALHFAKLSSTNTAGDAMIPAVWVKENDTVKDAFHKMHDNRLSGIPTINDRYEVTGYLNLLELLATYARKY